MMEAQMTMFMLIAIAVGAGLLAVLVLWLSKHIANEKTRSQGVTIAAITVGVLLMGLLVTRTSHRPMIGIHDTPVPPKATVVSEQTPMEYPSVAPPADSAGRIEAHAHHHPPPVEGRVAAKLAWGPLTIAAVVVAIIVLLTTSRKGLAASLAGLGIAGAVSLMIAYAALDKQMAPEVVKARVASATFESDKEGTEEWPPRPTRPGEATKSVEVRHNNNGTVTVTESFVEPNDDKSKADQKAPAEREASAEAPSTIATDSAQKAPPDWIHNEPIMENGVYRAVLVSGPYSTKRECEVHLDDTLRKAMMEYAESHLRPSARYAAWVDIGHVRNNMIEDRFLEEVRYEKIPQLMYNLHVRLKIEPRDVARFEQLARHWEERRAVETASAGGVFVFGALIVLYGGLRFLGRKKRANPVDSAPTPPTEATA